jgi:hypothetical protein
MLQGAGLAIGGAMQTQAGPSRVFYAGSVIVLIAEVER